MESPSFREALSSTALASLVNDAWKATGWRLCNGEWRLLLIVLPMLGAFSIVLFVDQQHKG